MVGHRDSNASEKKSSEAINDLPTFNTEKFANRTFMSIIGGVIAGILGFNSLMGFVLYFLVMAITSIGEKWRSTIAFFILFFLLNDYVLFLTLIQYLMLYNI
ncbi:hypothetical protein UlMin_041566 [Ulmus minor]